MSEDFDKSDGDTYGILSALNRATHIDDELQMEKEAAVNRLGDLWARRIGDLSSKHIQQAHVNGETTCSFSMTMKFPEAERHNQTNHYSAMAMFLDGSKMYEVEPDEGSWRDNIIFLHPHLISNRQNRQTLESLLNNTPIAKFSGAGSELTLTLGELCIHTESMLNASVEDKVKNRIQIIARPIGGLGGLSALEDILQSGHMVSESASLPRWTQNVPRNAENSEDVLKWREKYTTSYAELSFLIEQDFSAFLEAEEE